MTVGVGGVTAALEETKALRKQVAALEESISAHKADVERIRGHRETYKAKLKRREAQVKKWKLTALGLSVVTALLLVALVVKASGPDYALETVELVDDADVQWGGMQLAATGPLAMPGHVWSTGLIANSGIGGSAVIITPEGDGLSCGHCFRRVGEHFWYRRPDGVDIEAEVVAHAPWSRWGTRDLCLFHVKPEDVLAATPICLDDEPGALDVIGYPKCVGPVYHPLIELSDMGAEMRKFRVSDGGYVIGGNSGSPIFKTSQTSGKGMVVGILSGVNNDQAAIELAGWRARERRQQHQEVRGEPQLPIGTTAIVTKQETLIAFVKANKRQIRGRPFCDGHGNCYDAEGNLIQKQPTVQQPALQQPGPRVIQPNLPLPPKPGENDGEVAPPPDPNLTVEPYDGTKRQPKDLNSPRKKAIEIDKLRKAKPPVVQPQVPENHGEVAPPAENPAPAPPAVDTGVHSKLDALQNSVNSLHSKQDALATNHSALATSLKTGFAQLNANLPVPIDPQKLASDIISGNSQEVQKVFSQFGPQVLQTLVQELGNAHGDLKTAVDATLQKMGPQIAQQVKADAIPAIQTAVKTNMPDVAAAVESKLPAITAAVSAGAPGLLGMAGAIGGPVGLGLLGAGWWLSRGLKKQSDVSSTQTGVLAALVGHVANHTSANPSASSTASAPADSANTAPPPQIAPPAAPDPGLANLFSALQDLTSQLKKTAPQSSTPAPAGAHPSPEPCLTDVDPDETITPGGKTLNQILKVPSPPTVLQPGSIDRGLNAWGATMQMAAQKYPHLAINGTIKRIDALFRQAFSGTSS